MLKNITILITGCLALLSCNTQQGKQVNDQIVTNPDSIQQVKMSLTDCISWLGRPLKSLQFPNGYIVKDTVFVSEEDLTWNGLAVYDNTGQHLLLTIESNWEDKSKVYIISLVSNDLLQQEQVKIDDTFEKNKSFFDTIIPVMPDGYFALDRKSNTHIRYFLSHKEAGRLDSVGTIQHIPGDAYVTSVMIK